MVTRNQFLSYNYWKAQVDCIFKILDLVSSYLGCPQYLASLHCFFSFFLPLLVVYQVYGLKFSSGCCSSWLDFASFFFCSIVFGLLKFYIHGLLWLVFFNFMIYMNSFGYDWVLNCLFGVWDCNSALVFIRVVFVFLEFAWKCRINSMLGC